MSSRRRKIAALATVAALALFGFVYGLSFPSGALAWDNCPMGLVNDPYPGACRRYVDTNGDGICDLSQPEPAAATTTTKPPETTTTTELAVTTTTTGEPPTGDCPLGPCAGCGACASVGVSITVASSDDLDDSTGGVVTAALATGALAGDDSGDDSSGGTPTGGATSDSATGALAATPTAAIAVQDTGVSFLTHYLVSPIALGFFLVYGASFFLYKTKRIRVATHRKIWNVLLLGTFLVTGIFGLILAIQLDYPLPFSIPIDLLFWHVEAGIAMTLISLFHMGWHFHYYKNLLRRSRAKMREARAAERAFEADERGLVLEAREQRQAAREMRRTDTYSRYTSGGDRATVSGSPGGTIPSPWMEPGLE